MNEFTIFRKYSTDFYRGAASILMDLSPKAGMILDDILYDLASMETGVNEMKKEFKQNEPALMLADRATERDFLSSEWCCDKNGSAHSNRTKMASRLGDTEREWMKVRPELQKKLGLKILEDKLIGDESWVDPDEET